MSRRKKNDKKELIDLIASTSNLMDERKDIEEYIEELDRFIKSSEENKGLSEKEVMEGYQNLKLKNLLRSLFLYLRDTGLSLSL